MNVIEIKLKITIVTIVKNGMPFIKETVRSVISQGYESIEYIVVDSLSTDGTAEFLLKCKEKINRFTSENDAGIADAFNKGVASASGDYIMFLNADDKLYDSNSIACLVDYAKKLNQPTFLYGDCVVLERSSGREKYIASIDFNLDGIIKGIMPPHPSMIVHKSYFEGYGKFDTSFKIAMDYEWFIRGIKSSKIIHVPQIITSVRDGGVSTKNQIRVISEIIAALRKNNYLTSRYKIVCCWTYFLSRYLSRIILTKLGIYNFIKKSH